MRARALARPLRAVSIKLVICSSLPFWKFDARSAGPLLASALLSGVVEWRFVQAGLTATLHRHEGDIFVAAGRAETCAGTGGDRVSTGKSADTGKSAATIFACNF